MTKRAIRPELVDFVLVGAGISGVGLGRHFRVNHPDKSLIILEGRDSIGGTWDLFRYPGIRSDSDLHTFGYSSKPWKDEDSIADAPKIRAYLAETVRENGLDEVIRLRRRVTGAAWSSDDAVWTLDVDKVDPSTGSTKSIQIQTRWYANTTGYYRYDEGYTPSFSDEDAFQGDIVHAQHWPENYDYSGKKVVVIGSGATAFTLVPAMTAGPRAVAHVTQLQRTPTYVIAEPRKDRVALGLTRVLGADRAHPVIRWKNEFMTRVLVTGFRTYAAAAKRFIAKQVSKNLPEGCDVEAHFTPPYNPWDQRIALVPHGDYFSAISSGQASVVTDRIRRFTATGILLESGEELHADLIVKATGLNLQLLGGTPLTVDGEKVHLPDKLTYLGIMLSGVPNMVMVIGYTLSTWTLKIDLIWEQLNKLIRHLDANGYGSVVPVADPTVETRPLLDFTAGYIQRSLDDLPRRGLRAPWAMASTAWEDKALLKGSSAVDPVLRYTAAPVSKCGATTLNGREPVGGVIS